MEWVKDWKTEFLDIVGNFRKAETRMDWDMFSRNLARLITSGKKLDALPGVLQALIDRATASESNE